MIVEETKSIGLLREATVRRVNGSFLAMMATDSRLTTYHSTGPGPTTGEHEPRRAIYGDDTPGGVGASYGLPSRGKEYDLLGEINAVRRFLIN